jgi:hypothetical protein
MIDKEDLLVMLKDKTNREAATHFGVAVSTIIRYLKKYKLNYYNLKYDVDKFTQQQDDLMTACMLGDGTVHKQGRFRLKMKSTMKEYVGYAQQIFKPFAKEIHEEVSTKPKRGKNNKVIHGDSNELCYASAFWTGTHPLFKAIRDKWYLTGKKIVPSDLKLNPYILAHWYLQDGCNNQQRKTIVVCTNSFTTVEVDFLVDKVKELGINCNRQRKIINVGAKSYFQFVELVKPYVSFDCFQYKIDTTQVRDVLPNYGPNKLDMKKAIEIRRIIKSGCTRKEASKIYAVTRATIDRIVNNLIYKTNFHIGGNAKIEYNAELKE